VDVALVASTILAVIYAMALWRPAQTKFLETAPSGSRSDRGHYEPAIIVTAADATPQADCRPVKLVKSDRRRRHTGWRWRDGWRRRGSATENGADGIGGHGGFSRAPLVATAAAASKLTAPGGVGVIGHRQHRAAATLRLVTRSP
jgi:hypothetical protein